LAQSFVGAIRVGPANTGIDGAAPVKLPSRLVLLLRPVGAEPGDAVAPLTGTLLTVAEVIGGGVCAKAPEASEIAATKAKELNTRVIDMAPMEGMSVRIEDLA
jgi:hypothetical protein